MSLRYANQRIAMTKFDFWLGVLFKPLAIYTRYDIPSSGIVC
ncbi:MAG: hypothetical protein JWQ66_841 [Mucilaginibacter sp.]|nr:hypothetical protein [Mucilaginibacter sp.]